MAYPGKYGADGEHLLNDLKRAGVVLENECMIATRLRAAENWRREFINLAQMGRLYGMEMKGVSAWSLKPRRISRAMLNAGFEQGDVLIFLYNVAPIPSRFDFIGKYVLSRRLKVEGLVL